MVAAGSLSVAANALRSLLVSEISDLDVSHVKIGHPSSTFESLDQDSNCVNLFFYSVQPDGYPADASTETPIFIRMYCLVTAAAGSNTSPSPGENDLRLIGEVLRIFHQNPTLNIADGSDAIISTLQIVPHPLDLDDLNHVWSTQGDTPYRLSVAYELALAPVPLAAAVDKQPRVGLVRVESHGEMTNAAPSDPGALAQTYMALTHTLQINSTRPDWSPEICFLVTEDNALATTLLVSETELPGTGSLSMSVLIAGEVGADVDLVWETWSKSDGWQRMATGTTETITIETIDPDDVDADNVTDTALPLDAPGQAVLYAERMWTRPDGVTVVIKSNPLLVTVNEATP